MKKKKPSAKTKAVKNAVQDTFTELPRSAGVLLHITSLPSHFSIGDFGPEAYRFADFLRRSHQTVWQILPINSASSAQGFSPYGSDATFAGNTLLISPERLMEKELLSSNDMAFYINKSSRRTDFETAQRIKTDLLNKAYHNYHSSSVSKKDFQSFCKAEDHWLHPYSLFILLKEKHENKSWNQWERKYKDCDAKALQAFAAMHQQEMDQLKWQQWIFHQQWFALKEYCNHLGIKILGDLPFYVAYDSADVWMNKHLFHLDKNGDMLSESGAPPDDFDPEGQRWGMPVYRWDVAKKDNYQWWLQRMQKNIAMFDLLRLDHFRGFSAYWEIPIKATSAKEGEWKPTPGEAFFTLLKKETGSLPLVAEDLGTIDQPVIELRKRFHIPGMIIQQVSFGDDMPQSTSIPHHHYENAVLYTGNHDNNTTLSWYRSLPAELKKNIVHYTGKKVSDKNICEVMEHLVYASVARLAILPVQDILQLDEHSRMNRIPEGSKDWTWRMPVNAMSKKQEKKLQNLSYLYDRKRRETKKKGKQNLFPFIMMAVCCLTNYLC